MKNSSKIIVFVVLMISTTLSCEDYLITDSNSVFTEDNAFSNLDFAQKAVFGVYNELTSLDLYNYNLGYYFKMDTDIEINTGSDDGNKRSLSHYVSHDGMAVSKDVWELLYITIEKANICIDNIPNSPIWEGEFAKQARWLYAEAITIRALLYYELIMTWGDVPFSIKSTQADDSFSVPKTDRDEIYEHIIQDLADVEDFVPWMRETMTAERITKGYVKGLRAKVALAYAGYSVRNKTFEVRRGRNWQEYYQIANQECKEIMESGKHQLNPSFENIFKTICSYGQDVVNNEVLFEVANGRLRSGRVCQSLGMKGIKTTQTRYGGASAVVLIAPHYFYTFDNDDLRKYTTAEFYNYGSKSKPDMQVLVSKYHGFEPCKWRKEWVVPNMGGALSGVSYTGVNWPLMRYSDVVLMFAETENELNGPTAAAKDALSLVRQRAFPQSLWLSKVDAYINSVSGSKEDFFDAIVDERAWEFGGEFIRKGDLIRWNLLGTKIQEMRDGNEQMLAGDLLNVPDYLFYRYEDDGWTLDILNRDYRIAETEIPGYTRSSWTAFASSSSFHKKFDRVAHGWDPAKNNYLMHIHADIISASGGVLNNDQMQ